jgi:hypothetical protein
MATFEHQEWRIRRTNRGTVRHRQRTRRKAGHLAVYQRQPQLCVDQQLNYQQPHFNEEKRHRLHLTFQDEIRWQAFPYFVGHVFGAANDDRTDVTDSDIR